MNKHKKHLHEILSVILLLAMALSGTFYLPQSAEAATFTFNQTDWSGGTSASTAVHPTNQTGWTYSSSASSTIATSTSGQISLASTTASVTKTTDTDFSGGTFSSTTVSGTGNGASVILASSTTYVTSGTYTSPTIDLGQASDFTTLQFSKTIPSQIHGDWDLLIGNNSSIAILGYENTGSVTSPTWTAKSAWNGPVIGMSAAALANLDGDGDYDLLEGSNNYDSVYAYKNTGSASSPTWTYTSSWNVTRVGQYKTHPAFADLDNDGDYDLLIGDNNGISYGYKNTGSATNPSWTATSTWDAPDIDSLCSGVNMQAKPALADLDNDGDKDILIGTYCGISFAYENTGSATSPVWTRKASWDTPDTGDYSSPAFADLDNDGDYDLLIGDYNGISYGYENTGSVTSPTWTAKSAWNTVDIGIIAQPALADLDYDTTPFRVQVSANNDNSTWNYLGPDGTSGTYFTSTGTAIPSSLNGNRYFRYKLYLNTTNTAYTPSLDDITINYLYYVSGNLTSSAFNSTDAANIIGKISWTESATSTNETIKFQIRSSADGSSWSNWCGYADTGATCAGTNYFESTHNNVSLASGHPLKSNANDQWFQYKVFLNSGGTATPALSDATITYVVNSPPQFDSTFGTNGISVSQIATSTDANFGKVQIQFAIKDTDTTSGTNSPNYLTPSFEYNTGSGWNNISSSTISWAAAPGGGGYGTYNNSTTTKALEGSYLTYAVYWDAGSQLGNNTYTASAQIRTTVNDNEQANNTATATGANFTLDTKKPVVASNTLLINNSSAAVETTTSTITLKIQNITGDAANETIYVQFSRDGLTWYGANSDNTLASAGSWGTGFGLNATSTLSWQWTLQSRSETITVKIRDAYGNTASSTDTNSAGWNAPPQFNSSFGANGVSISQIATSTDANWGKVTIQYSARDQDTASGTSTPGFITPSFEYNIGGGWASSTDYMAAGDTSNKAVGADTYASYTAVWDVKSQISETYAASAQVRVRINDNEPINNIAVATSTSFALDAKNPVVASTILNSASGTLALSVSDDSNIEYRVSNNSDLSADSVNSISGAWQSVGGNSTSTSLSWTAGGYPSHEKVYVNAKDVYGNNVTSTIVAPLMPVSFSVKDISNPTAAYYEEFINWQAYSATTSAAFANYKLYRSTDGASYSVYQTITDVNTNYYRDTSISSSTIYYYKMLISDTDGDSSRWSTIVSDLPDGQGGSDYTAPTISSASSTVQATWVKITWTTDELATGEINYSASSTAYDSTASSTSYVISHEITLTGLTPNTLYYYRIKSKDVSNNSRTDDNNGSGYSFTTAGGPAISDVATQSVSNSAATITWNTNKAASSRVVYSVSVSDLQNNSNVSDTGDNTLVSGPPYQHIVNLSSLSSRTTYYYYVKSTDSDSNIATDTNGGNYYSFRTTYDTKAPVITNVATPVITKTAVIITWQTDEPTTSQAEYGGSGSYTSASTIDSTLSIYHNVVIVNLSQKTKYYYRVRSKDAENNEALSDEKDFTTSDVDQVIVSTAGGSAPAPQKDTTPPAISRIEAIDVGAFNATISFTTSESATSFALYGRDASYGATAGSSDYASEHKIKLSGLRPGTEYNFKVKAQDKDGNIGISGDNKFSTKYASEALEETVTLENASQFQDRLENLIESTLPSLVPPFIGGVNIASTTENSVSVSWRSNVSSYGALAYASENDYGADKNNPYTVELSAGDKKERDHTVNMTGLSPSTIYHIQAKGFVIPGAVGKSKDITFLTKASRIKAEVTRLGNTDVDVRWTSPTDTSSFVEYRNLRSGKIGRTGDDAKIKSHAITVKDLEPDTSYQLKVFGYDNNNNIAEGDPITVRTKKDVAPPEISNIRIDNALLPGRSDRLQSVVSWRTNEQANSVVYFEEGVGINEVLANKAGQEKEYNADHIVIITSLKPSTIYRIQISSADESGNLSKSPIRSILTPRSAESVLDVITRNLQETFGFLKNINQ